MGKQRNKMRLLIILFAIGIIGCSKKTSNSNDHEAQVDSIFSDFTALTLMTYYWNDRDVFDQAPSSLDTIELLEDIRLPTNLPMTIDEKEIFITIENGSYLIPENDLGQLSKVNVYNKDWKFINEVYCSNNILVQLDNPDINDQKIAFYERHRGLMNRVTKKLSEKYKITEDSLKTIVYLRLEVDRNKSTYYEITQD